MRVTTVFNKLLRLPGVFVTAVAFEQVRIVVDVRLKSGGWSARSAAGRPEPGTTGNPTPRPGGRSTWARGESSSAPGCAGSTVPPTE